MAEMNKHFNGGGVCQLIDYVIGEATTDSTVTGILQRRSGNNRLQTHDGIRSQQVAYLSDIAEATPFLGGYDASTTLLPTAATIISQTAPPTPFRAGQYVRITKAGTITGVGGSDALKENDLLLYLGENTSAANSTAANWYGVAQAIDLSPYLAHGVVVKDIPANVATRFTPPAGFSYLTNFVVLEGTKVKNGCFEEDFAPSGADLGITLTSLTAKSNIVVIYTGTLG